MPSPIRDVELPRFSPGNHIVRPIPFKAHKVNLMSAEMIEQRFETRYATALQHLNDIENQLAALDWVGATPLEIRNLKQEELKIED